MTSVSTWSRARKARLAACAAAGAALLALTAPSPARGDEEGCLGCHGLPGFSVRSSGAARNLWLDAAASGRSAHADVECRECHRDIVSIPHGETREVGCGQACHGQSADGKLYSHEGLYWEYVSSSHGRAQQPRIGCLVCHPEPPRREEAGRDKPGEARRCAACHRRSARVQAWFSDRHAVALAAGEARAPSCPDCHGSHGVGPASAPESPVSAKRIAATCASGALASGRKGGCHGSLSPAAVAGATMSPFPRQGIGRGVGAALTLLAGALLVGLIARAGIGLARGR